MDSLLSLAALFGALTFATLVAYGLSRLLALRKPEATGRVFLSLTFAACLGYLVVHAVPGLLDELLSVVILILLPALLLLSLVGVVTLLWLVLPWTRFPDLRRYGFGMWTIPIWILMLLTTWIALRIHLPERIGFATSKPAFEALVESAPVRRGSGQDPGERIGVYHVDAYARDERGGVYFRTGKGSRMIDWISYGFAYEPNKLGTPFGNASYDYWPLGDGWYVFSAPDDW